jgi:hypothetical protein
MSIFVSFKHIITSNKFNVLSEGFRSEIFDELDPPFDEESLNLLRSYICKMLIGKDDSLRVVVDILFWKELKSSKKINFKKYIIAETSKKHISAGDYGRIPKLFGLVGKKFPKVGDFVLKDLKENVEIMVKCDSDDGDETEVWAMIDEGKIGFIEIDG